MLAKLETAKQPDSLILVMKVLLLVLSFARAAQWSHVQHGCVFLVHWGQRDAFCGAVSCPDPQSTTCSSAQVCNSKVGRSYNQEEINDE